MIADEASVNDSGRSASPNVRREGLVENASRMVKILERIERKG